MLPWEKTYYETHLSVRSYECDGNVIFSAKNTACMLLHVAVLIKQALNAEESEVASDAYDSYCSTLYPTVNL